MFFDIETVFWHWNCTYTKLIFLDIELFWLLTVFKQNLYLYYTEITESELLD